MQTISLYDHLSIEAKKSETTEITLSGTSEEIPYNEKNLVFKAAKLFLEESRISAKINIFIEKNIPIAAGLAGGSTDAAGTIYGLNEILGQPFSREKLHELCAKLGSDLNVCLEGGTLLATSRGEVIQKLDCDINYPVTLIKPKKLGISAKEAYTKYAAKKIKPQNNMTEKLIDAIKNQQNIQEFLYNDLEYAIFDDYQELQTIKEKLPTSIMSGSGSTYFILGNLKENIFNDTYQVISDLQFINKGVCSEKLLVSK